MKQHRFKVDDLSGDLIDIEGAEAHHALRVVRCKKGDEILIFDGNGAEATAVIETTSAHRFSARVIERRSRPMKRSELIIATAIPKGERADWLIEKCAELGVALVVPLVTERSQVNPGQGKIARWQKKVDAAAKQSGQTTLMMVEEPALLADFLEDHSGIPLTYGDLSGVQSLSAWLSENKPAGSWAFIIGPEGGLSEVEIQRITQAGGVGLRLGPGTLRIETAALAVAAMANAMCP